MRAAIWSVDPDQPVTYLLPLTELAAESLTFRRTGMILAGGFGALALLLAAIGIYGVLSYSVSRRTREIGVRVALGATRSEVARLVVREALVMTAAGIVIGLAAALALSRFMESVLFEVTPADPLTYVMVATILLAVAGRRDTHPSAARHRPRSSRRTANGIDARTLVGCAIFAMLFGSCSGVRGSSLSPS